MKTITIDIPDGKVDEVIDPLQKMGVKVHESKLSALDKLTKKDYKKHFYKQAKETNYLLKSPANAARLLQSIEDYKNGLGKERNLMEE